MSCALAAPQCRFTFLQILRELVAFQIPEFRQFFPDRTELRSQEVPDVRTGGHFAAAENQKLSNLAEREAEFLSTTNEVYTPHIACAEQPEPSVRPRGMFEEPLFLVETDGVNGKPGLVRHLPDLKPLRHTGLRYPAYTLERTPESSCFFLGFRRRRSPRSGAVRK